MSYSTPFPILILLLWLHQTCSSSFGVAGFVHFHHQRCRWQLDPHFNLRNDRRSMRHEPHVKVLTTKLFHESHTALFVVDTQNYAPAATALFVNMLTPASILAAGMISIGLKAPFQMPTSIQDQPAMLRQIEALRRTYILVTLISFCSEILAVMWATVAVNQLTERTLPPTSTVWELLQRECDLEWAAVNSHFVIGLVGFMYMVGIRGYIMLLEVEASDALIASLLTGVGAAVLLMVSIVNRGVESGGGDGVGYGSTVLDLFGHYVTLLYQRSAEINSLGPMGLGAIVLQLASVAFAVYAIVCSQIGLGEDVLDVNAPKMVNSDLGSMKGEETFVHVEGMAALNDTEKRGK